MYSLCVIAKIFAVVFLLQGCVYYIHSNSKNRPLGYRVEELPTTALPRRPTLLLFLAHKMSAKITPPASSKCLGNGHAVPCPRPALSPLCPPPTTTSLPLATLLFPSTAQTPLPCCRAAPPPPSPSSCLYPMQRRDAPPLAGAFPPFETAPAETGDAPLRIAGRDAPPRRARDATLYQMGMYCEMRPFWS